MKRGVTCGSVNVYSQKSYISRVSIYLDSTVLWMGCQGEGECGEDEDPQKVPKSDLIYQS